MSVMGDVGWDFVGLLPPEVASKILTWLDDPSDIVRASSVSRAWFDFVISNGICKHLCLRLFPRLSCIARVVDRSNTQLGSSRSFKLEQSKKNEHVVFASLARGLTSSEVGNECISRVIGASSTDRDPEESIYNTLEPRDQIGGNASYWSSSGQSNPDVPERLTYKLSHLCVITEINIQPFQAFFQAYSPIYSAKAVRFRTGYSLPSDDKHFVWTYTSKEFPMAQENRLQNFKLPDPVLCVGGIIQIELLGKVQRQETNGLFYVCVAYVQVLGRSLSPLFMVKPLEPPGTFVLTFDPILEEFIAMF